MSIFSPHALGIAGNGTAYRNLPVPILVEKALANKEGHLTDSGALAVHSGKYTGRSPNDRFIVDTASVHDKIAWGTNNHPIAKNSFDILHARVLAYLQDKEIYVFDGLAGADSKYSQKFRVINELASQNLFIHQLLIRADNETLDEFTPNFTVIAAPGFKCDPDIDGVCSEAAVVIDFDSHQAIIVGSGYCGEIKKCIFSIMNYILPQLGVLPMHCSANSDLSNSNSALFFGLSGTGKTTLSSDPERLLIGDDEHGWSDDGIFNIEGGCYAKCINLDPEKEPEIYGAIKFGSVLENVIIDENGSPNYNDGSLTDNTRAGYPVEYIRSSCPSHMSGHPQTIIFLTADAHGVLPPISRLDYEAAVYHFISGYTSKVAGTELGITEPVTTFSTMFGAPFFPLKTSVYTSMLSAKLNSTGTRVFLVNTGWCGGKAGDVPRIKLKYTRAMVTAAISGWLDNVSYVHDPIFNLDIPESCLDVPSQLLNPRRTWQSEAEYEAQAKKLAQLFIENFNEKYRDLPENIVAAGPRIDFQI